MGMPKLTMLLLWNMWRKLQVAEAEQEEIQ